MMDIELNEILEKANVKPDVSGKWMAIDQVEKLIEYIVLVYINEAKLELNDE